MNKTLISDIKQILDLQSQIKLTYDKDVFRNQKYRELLVADIIQSYEPTYQLISDKVDFITATIHNGEIKSCKVDKLKNGLYSLSAGRFEFDKQNDSARRENTRKYDGFTFGMFDSINESHIVGVFYITSIVGVTYIDELIGKKQEEFLKKMEVCERENKQITRDSIQLSIREIFECPDCLILDNEGTQITLEVLKSKFNQKHNPPTTTVDSVTIIAES